MSGLLDKIFKREPAPGEPSKGELRTLEGAKQEARTTQLRKELLAREVQATIARLHR